MTALKYRLTDRGLMVTAKLSYQDWLEIGDKLARHHSGVQWAIGDWLLAMPKTGSWEDTFEDVQEILPFCWETLRMHYKVSAAFPPAQRRLGLAWSFYKLAMPLHSAHRLAALEKAKRDRITYTEFVKWVEGRMEDLPTTRIKNPTARAFARPHGQPRRSAGLVNCPHCGHEFRVAIETPKPTPNEVAA